ncbi:MAG: hypothetical protein ACXIVG_01910 [Pararhodobacter sp.]
MAAPMRDDDPLATPPGRPEWLAFALSLAWLVLVVALAWWMARRGIAPAEALAFVLVALAVFLPVVMIWQTVLMLRAVSAMRAEALRLRAMGGLMREAALQPVRASNRPGALVPGTHQHGAGADPARGPDPVGGQGQGHGNGYGAAPVMAAAATPTDAPAVADAGHADAVNGTLAPDATGTAGTPEPDTMGDAAAPAQAPPAPALFASRRAAVTGSADNAPLLSLDKPQPTSASVALDDLIRALHFPETEDDTEGFAALRRALRDHATAELIRSAQTVLSGLAEEGIFLDQLTPDRARPALWRAFAQGARGPAMAPLGGIRDRSCLALTVARMRGDPAFRDAAHRFLRAFDQRLGVIEPQASDAQIARLAETRSARAFMLLGRVTGVFG